MKSFVFVVHGMGRHPKDTWADGFKRVIYENLRLYAPYTEKSDEELARDDLEIIPINYDDVFEEGFRKVWVDLAGAIENRALLGKFGAVLEWIDSGATEEKDFFWDYVFDPLLWFTNKQARQATIAHVAAQLAAGIDKIKQETGEVEANIVAHSLGTSVIHDTLLSLSDSDLTKNAFAGRNYKWRTLVQVSNVSRLLQAWMTISQSIPVEKYKPHRSAVRPGGRGALVKRFFNLRHRADPFTWPREFDPQWSVNTYKQFTIKRYDELRNVHDFETNFDHPGAHMQIFQSILGNRTLGSQNEQERAWAAYDQVYGRVAGDEFHALRELLHGDAERKLGPVERAKFILATWKELKS